MTVEKLSVPEWPPDNPELEAAIGQLIIAWAMLERSVDAAIETLYGLELDLAASVTANLGTKAKLDLVQSGAACLAECIKPLTVKHVDDLAAETSEASTKYRNFIAHGHPLPLIYHDAEHEWFWGKPQARKGGPAYNLMHLDPIAFITGTSKIKALWGRWELLRQHISPGLRLYYRYRDDPTE